MNVKDMQDLMIQSVEKLRDNPNLSLGEVTDEQIRRAVAETFTDRKTKNFSGLRARTALPKGDVSDLGRAYFTMLKWHMGSGDLTPMMMLLVRVGEDTLIAGDSLALITLALSGKRSSATQAWRNLGLV